MSSAVKSENPDDDDAVALEVAANEAIAAYDGDVRGAVKALIVANSFLESELADVYARVSNGYMRGRVPRQPEPE